MKKIIKRIFAWTLLSGIVTISGTLTIVLFPEPLFAHQLEHGNFKVYSDKPIDKSIEGVLDNALTRVKKSELFDPEYRFDVFLSHNTLFGRIDDKLLGRGPSARATDNNVVVKVAIDPVRNVAFSNIYEDCEADLTWLISHEMMHCLQENRYGKWTFNPFKPPVFWKLEGYPEYISRQPMLSDPNYSLKNEIQRYVDLDSGSPDQWIPIVDGRCNSPKYYYRARIMTEYLIDIRHFTYHQILHDTTSADAVFAEMVAWKQKM
jgi:hypothetical protein